jgi:hypothetical protein
MRLQRTMPIITNGAVDLKSLKKSAFFPTGRKWLENVSILDMLPKHIYQPETMRITFKADPAQYPVAVPETDNDTYQHLFCAHLAENVHQPCSICI